MKSVKLVSITAEAIKLVEELREAHGDLMFHQSGGCCDGSAPMCYVKGEFKTGGADVYLGEIAECPFYIGRQQYAAWKHTHLIIDVVKGRGSGFSLEAPRGVRFLTRSRLFTQEETDVLENQQPASL